MMKLVIYANSIYECALCELKDKEIKVLKIGSCYDKIHKEIEGFIFALNYIGIEYELNKINVTPNDKIFEMLGFENFD